MRPAANFISELIRAANEVDQLAPYERANLLQRAAFTIKDCREQVGGLETVANDGGPGDIVHDLRVLSGRVEILTDEDVSLTLLTAAEVIKNARVLLDKRHGIERGE